MRASTYGSSMLISWLHGTHGELGFSLSCLHDGISLFPSLPAQVEPWIVKAIGAKLLEGKIDQVSKAKCWPGP